MISGSVADSRTITTPSPPLDRIVPRSELPVEDIASRRGVAQNRAMFPDAERFQLLAGPYRAPALAVDSRATCLFRDCEVVVTSWTGARISWPRCRVADSSTGGGS